MKQLTLGIHAHVDAGKTTLAEAMLFRSGEIRTQGRVDNKNAFLDTHEIEKERGITIFSKQAVMSLEHTNLTLLDTPGHVDFSTEMERTLQVLDVAVLVISGIDGVQSHTETLWRLLSKYNIPTFIFVNKTDVSLFDKQRIFTQLRQKLSEKCVDFSKDNSDFSEDIAMCSDKLTEEFFESGEISQQSLKSAINERGVFPCFFGSALRLIGIDEFLTAIDLYTVMPELKSEFSAKVFKISEDEQGNRLTHMKITGGKLCVRSQADYVTKNGDRMSEKISSVRIYSGVKFTSVTEVTQGVVCAVTGLSQAYAGQGLGCEENCDVPMLEPVLSYCVKFPPLCDTFTMLEKLRKLEEEEPALNVIYNEQLQEIHVALMGEVQLEVLKCIIADRFHIDVEFGQGKISYRETISDTVEGVGHFEPLRHYAEVHLLLEPLKRGSGLKFATNCREETLSKNWQRLILTHLNERTHVGVLTGSPVTDMKITLIAGKAHLKHTEGGDFRQATYRAVRQGLAKAESIGKAVLLEPFYSFRLEVPTENAGHAMTDIQQMNGTISPPDSNNGFTIITGKAPVSQMRGYQAELTSYTKGRGHIYCELCGYEECHNSDEIIAQTGYDFESDIANSPDSVFCANGAGFNVKWNEVENHMHVQSGYSCEKAEEKSTAFYHKKAAEYCDRLALDKELMEIYERTYGKIERNEQAALYTERTPKKDKDFEYKPVHKGNEYLLVDGYNIIHSWNGLKEIASDSLDTARSKLINILCNYQGFTGCELILVFDAYKVKGHSREIEKFHNINIVYTKEKETADTYIERATHELAGKHKVRVATSDGMEQVIILGNGALRVSSAEFYEEVKNVEKAIRDYIEHM